MNEEVSTRLLSAIRAAAEVPGKGSADASGFAWHAWYKGNALSVTAHEDSRGTRIQILLDRKASMILRLYFALVAVVMSAWMAIESINSVPELLAWAVIPAGLVAATRAFWKSSTRSIREKMAALANAVRESLPAGDDDGGQQETPDQ